MRLIAFDAAAAFLSSFVAALQLRSFFYGWSESVERGDYGPLLLFSLEFAVIAVILAIPYSRWVSAAGEHPVRRAAITGPLYAAAIVLVFAVLSAVFADYRSQPGWSIWTGLLYLPAAALVASSPYWFAGGVFFGWMHGMLARQIAHPSGNASIVA